METGYLTRAQIVKQDLDFVWVRETTFRIVGTETIHAWYEATEPLDKYREILTKYPCTFTNLFTSDDDENYTRKKFIVWQFQVLGFQNLIIEIPNNMYGDDFNDYRIGFEGKFHNFSTSQNTYVAKLSMLFYTGILNEAFGIVKDFRYGKGRDGDYNSFKKCMDEQRVIPFLLTYYGFDCSALAFISLQDFLRLDWSKFNFGKIIVDNESEETREEVANQSNISKFLLEEFNTPYTKAGEVTNKQKADWLLKFIEKNSARELQRLER